VPEREGRTNNNDGLVWFAGVDAGKQAVAVTMKGRLLEIRVTGRLAIVVRKGVPESLVDTLINQNAHFLRTGEQKFLCFLERSASGSALLSRERREFHREYPDFWL
jgi:hypothetical protein